jgi:hypothetical protein
MSDVATWVATLSNGHTLTERDFNVEPGQRKPWVQLTELLTNSGNTLTSLRLNFKGRTIHMPRANFGQFDYNDINRAPLCYSLCYHLEGDITFGNEGELMQQTHYIELAAHYGDFMVRFIQDITNGNNSWVVVTDEKRAMAETPRN